MCQLPRAQRQLRLPSALPAFVQLPAWQGWPGQFSLMCAAGNSGLGISSGSRVHTARAARKLSARRCAGQRGWGEHQLFSPWCLCPSSLPPCLSALRELRSRPLWLPCPLHLPVTRAAPGAPKLPRDRPPHPPPPGPWVSFLRRDPVEQRWEGGELSSKLPSPPGKTLFCRGFPSGPQPRGTLCGSSGWAWP